MSAEAVELSAVERLINVVQDLSHAYNMQAVTEVIRTAGRALTGADGATFVLRDQDQCYYVEENAISPLWKGRRFPMSACISDWVMQHGEAAVIEDIYADPRIPVEAYRPTFVKSLVMVPVRRNAPIAAIGNYWATARRPTTQEVSLLQALADTAAVAIENAQLYTELEKRLHALQESNYELGRFAWVASHDLQEPLRTIVTQMELLERRCGSKLDEKAQGYIATASESSRRLQALIEDMLVHASAEKVDDFKPVNLSKVLDSVIRSLQEPIERKGARISKCGLPEVEGEEMLLFRLLQNLISNALKFHHPGATPDIAITCEKAEQGWRIAVSDNGIGISPAYHQRIFGYFQRLHPRDLFPGSGIGLASCKKIVELHGGKIGVESCPDEGSMFWFTLPHRQFLKAGEA